MHACMLSHFSFVRLFVTQWTVGCQVPLSMGFSRKEYWSGLPCPPPGNSNILLNKKEDAIKFAHYVKTIFHVCIDKI